MKLTVVAFASLFVLAIALSTRPAGAATTVQSSASAVSLANDNSKNNSAAKDDVKDSKDKAPKSKKNPNDGKDGVPNDGNAGGGNDNKNK